MTIAACYLSVDGIVFGADSTSTIFVQGLGPNPVGGEHHYNFAQKIFQIGNESTLGITMWGLGNLSTVSYRTLIAEFADNLVGSPPKTLDEVASRWNDFFWNVYSAELGPTLKRVQDLLTKQAKTQQELDELSFLIATLSGGFCLGGNLLHDRRPRAFEIGYDPGQSAPRPAQEMSPGTTRFWGWPSLMERLLYGVDNLLLQAILKSGKWTGSQQELFDLILPHCLGQPLHLPIREAVDWVYASIYTTIKTMKFSHLAPVCGGPVEIAVITTDRPFRWVRHKKMDAAIVQGGFSDA